MISFVFLKESNFFPHVSRLNSTKSNVKKSNITFFDFYSAAVGENSMIFHNVCVDSPWNKFEIIFLIHFI